MPKSNSRKSGAGRIVVIGASIGGVETINRLVSGLPADFAAPLLIVLHTSAHGPGLLPEILKRAVNIPVQHAHDGQPVAPAQIYIAPPDHHLVLENGCLHLNRGPRVNSSRPSIDVLFHSAAAAHGERVIGVLLTGSLSDGSLGLAAIKEKGGTTIVQDPEDAFCPEMPLNAIRNAPIDYTAPLAQIPGLLVRLAAGEKPAPSARLRENKMRGKPTKSKSGQTNYDLICPDCGGPLREEASAGAVQYRCRIGHTFSTETLLAEHGEGLERSLWAAVQLLEERADLLRRVASRLPGPAARSKKEFETKARKCEADAAAIRKVFENM